MEKAITYLCYHRLGEHVVDFHAAANNNWGWRYRVTKAHGAKPSLSATAPSYPPPPNLAKLPPFDYLATNRSLVHSSLESSRWLPEPERAQLQIKGRSLPLLSSSYCILSFLLDLAKGSE